MISITLLLICTKCTEVVSGNEAFSSNSQFEVCSIVPLDIKGSLAGILDFGEDLVSEAGSDSDSISSHDASKTTRTVIIIRNPRSYQQFLHPSTKKSYGYTLFKR